MKQRLIDEEIAQVQADVEFLIDEVHWLVRLGLIEDIPLTGVDIKRHDIMDIVRTKRL